MASSKMFGPFGISHIETHQAPSHELSPTKQVLPGEKVLWNQVIFGLANIIVGLSTEPDQPENNQKSCYVTKD